MQIETQLYQVRIELQFSKKGFWLEKSVFVCLSFMSVPSAPSAP